MPSKPRRAAPLAIVDWLMSLSQYQGNYAVHITYQCVGHINRMSPFLSYHRFNVLYKYIDSPKPPTRMRR